MRFKADISESNNSGGPGGLGESGILIWRAHMINEVLTNWVVIIVLFSIIPEGVLDVEVFSR